MQLIIEKSFHPRSRPLSRTHDDDDDNKIYFPFLYFPFLSFPLFRAVDIFGQNVDISRENVGIFLF